MTASDTHERGSKPSPWQIGEVSIEILEQTGDAQFDGYEAVLRDLFDRPESEQGEEIERILG